MPALNRVQLLGYLGKDPESRFTPNGKKVAHFSVEDKGETKYYTKVVALSLQFLDRKPADEPVMMVDEEAAEYEA